MSKVEEKRFIHIELVLDKDGNDKLEVVSRGLKGYEQVGLLMQLQVRISDGILKRQLAENGSELEFEPIKNSEDES